MEAGPSDVAALICQEDGAPMDNRDGQQQCSLCSLRVKEINRLLEENRKLKEDLSKKALDETFFKGNDSKVKYYTGIPTFALLMGVLAEILPSLPKRERKVSHFQMLLLTLMRLRLCLSFDYIAHLFDISRQTTCNLFTEMIFYMDTSALWCTGQRGIAYRLACHTST